MKSVHKLHFPVSTLHFTLAAFCAVFSASAATLPSGYTEVEYIASSGTQYIDTGVVPKSTTRLVCDFRFPAVPSARVRCGWGSAGSQEALWFGNTADFSDFATSVSATYVQTQPGVAVDTERHVFDLARGSLKFDGHEYSTEATLGDTALTGKDTAGNLKTMYLFTLHQGWNPPVGPCGSMELYSCKIYDGAALVRDFVPAINSSNVAGLYDRVTGNFFTNQGTGSFTAGDEAHAALADGYKELEYIYMEGGASSGQQNDTATHYINTGVVPSGDWTINAEFASTNTLGVNNSTTPVYSTLFCARTAGNANSFLFWPHVGSSTAWGVARIDVGSSQTLSRGFISNPQAAITQGARHTVAIKPSSSGKIAGYFDGVRVTDEYTQFGSSVCPLYLFSAYTGASDGSRSNVKFSFEGRFYSLTADDGSGARRLDLVPALRKADNAVGLYDRVSETFFTNQGSGTFTAGPVYAPPYYVGVEYIACDGNQYIDTLWTNGSDQVVTLDIQPTELPTVSGTGAGGVITYYGCRSAYNVKNFSFFMDFVSNKPAFSVDFNNGDYQTYRLNAGSVSTDRRYVVVDSAEVRSVTGYDASGNVVSTASDADNCSASFTCAGSAYLFAINDMSGGSPAFLWNNKAKMKFYGGTVETVDGTPCCNLVPCLKNGVVPGVYDTVRDVFLPNAGSGTFTYGAETGVIYGLEPEGDDFVASPIPDQFAATPAALAAGIEPSVTVSNLTTSAELLQGTDYTVAYSNNTATGTAYAIVTGAGDYAEKSAIVPFVIDCPFDASNYEITVEEGTFTITPRPITVTADDIAVLVGSDDPELTVTIHNLVDGDTIEYTIEREQGSEIGQYVIKVNGETVQNNGNYSVTFVDGTFTIYRKQKGILGNFSVYFLSDTMIDWANENAKTDDAVAMLGSGNVVAKYDDADAWQLAKDTLDTLPNKLPYYFAAGSSDVDGDAMNYEAYLAYNLNKAVNGARFDDGQLWYTVNDAHQLLMIGIGYQKIAETEEELERQEQWLAFVNRAIAQHADYGVVLVLSDYIDENGELTAFGQLIEEKIVSVNEMVCLILCGNANGAARWEKTYGERTVNAVMYNYQADEENGLGFLRTVTFNEKERTITVATYSPVLDATEYDKAHPEKDAFVIENAF